MNHAIAETEVAVRTRFRGPIWTLLLLAPFLGEVLSGSTRTSVLFVYIPEVMVWGVGTLLCRELVRRWRAGGVSLLLLGLALAVAEEFIIQQTSIAPLPFPGVNADYGRMWGVNLVYFLFMLGFESVWVVLVPVQITELFFSKVREMPWLRARGAMVSCAVFLLGSRAAWYGWTQQARPRLQAAPYSPSWSMLAAGFLMIGVLILLAYLLRNAGRTGRGERRGTVRPWVVAVAALVLGFAWFQLIGQVFVPRPVQPFWIAMGAGLVWAGIALLLFGWWTSRPNWSPLHTLWASLGAALGCMAAPCLSIAGWPLLDVAGIVLYDLLAVVGMVLLARKVDRESRTSGAAPIR